MADKTFTDLRSLRLLLRRLRRDDLAALCAYRALPEVARYQDWESFGPDEAARLIDSQSGLEPNIPGTWFQLAIVVAATGELVGDCGLHCRSEDPGQIEIGITLAPDHQRRGYASEAIECLLGFVFGTLGKHQVTVDQRRFRANIYVDLPSEGGFGEQALVGRSLRIGPKAVVYVTERDPRCKMITLDPIPANPTRILRQVAQAHDATAGVYSAVLVEGTVRRGDMIDLLD